MINDDWVYFVFFKQSPGLSWHSLCFISICLFTLHQTRRSKTLPCLPITSESSWPSKCVLECLHECLWSASDCLHMLVLDFYNTETWVNVFIDLSLCPDRALEVPLTDLSFDDREISLSKGPLAIYDSSSLLEFNLLARRLGWVEGDWMGWLDRVGCGCEPGLFGHWRWTNTDTCWLLSENTHRRIDHPTE